MAEVLARTIRNHPRAAIALAISTLCLWSFGYRLWDLTRSAYPVGVDGYYYAIQVRAILEDGWLYYSSSPLVHFLSAPFAAIWGPILGTKIAAALGMSLLPIPIYAIGRRSGGHPVYGLFAAALAAVSVQSQFLSAEFVKTGIGLVLAAVYVVQLLRCLERPTRLRVIITLATLGLVTLSHPLAAVVAIGLSLPPWLYAATQTGAFRGRLSVGVTLAAATAIIAAVVIAIAAPQLPALLANSIRGTSNFALPALERHGPPLVLGHESLLSTLAAWLAAITLVVVYRHDRTSLTHHHAVVFAGAVLGIVIGLPWLNIADPNGLGFRLRVISFFCLALTSPWLARLAVDGLARRASEAMKVAIVVSFTAGWALSRPAVAPENPLYAGIAMGRVQTDASIVSDINRLGRRLPQDAVVISATRQLMFMVTWYSRKPARLQADSVPANQRWRLVPRVLLSPELAKSLIEQDLLTQSSTLALIAEAPWQRAIATLPQHQQQYYQDWRFQ